MLPGIVRPHGSKVAFGDYCCVLLCSALLCVWWLVSELAVPPQRPNQWSLKMALMDSGRRVAVCLPVSGRLS